MFMSHRLDAKMMRLNMRYVLADWNFSAPPIRSDRISFFISSVLDSLWNFASSMKTNILLMNGSTEKTPSKILGEALPTGSGTAAPKRYFQRTIFQHLDRPRRQELLVASVQEI